MSIIFMGLLTSVCNFFSNSCNHAGPKLEILHRDQVQHINAIQ